MCNSKLEQIKQVFILLKQRSYAESKNLVTMNNIAKESKTSRNNFYEQAKKSKEWSDFVKEIKDFKIEYDNYLNLKTKPSKEQKKIADLSKKLKIQMEQNLELLSDKNHLCEQINEKNTIIEHLEKRIHTQMQINYNGDNNEK